MIKPCIRGNLFTKSSEHSTFKNRTTGVSDSYIKHSVDLICTEPQKGVATIKVYSDNDALGLKEGTDYVVELTSFTMEKGTPIIVANEKDFKEVKK